MISFCPKCGSLLVPSDEKKTLGCSCGYTMRSKAELVLKEKHEKHVAKKVDVKKEDTLCKVNEDCPKCKHGEAYNWSLQTRATDEPETQFYRCTSCKHTWREYA
jgi:transcription factor S